MFNKIDRILKTNRQILKKFNRGGQATVLLEDLKMAGFQQAFTTHSWKAKNRNQYFFCYEFGFRNLEDGKKSMLIIYQPYMWV